MNQFALFAGRTDGFDGLGQAELPSSTYSCRAFHDGTHKLSQFPHVFKTINAFGK